MPGSWIVIASWLDKGGVGKTTLTVNTAGALAAQGKKVLMMDLDGQGNLTDFFADELGDDAVDTVRSQVAQRQIKRKEELAIRLKSTQPEEEQAEEDQAEEEQAEAEEEPRQKYDVPEGELPPWRAQTCKIRPIESDHLAAGAIPWAVVDSLAREGMVQEHSDFHPVTCYQACDGFIDNSLQDPVLINVNKEASGDKMWLLPGDDRWPELCRTLPPQGFSTLTAAESRAVLCVRGIIERIQPQHGFDVILLDLPPGSHDLNQMILSNADLIIPSFKPDHFSWSAVKELMLNVNHAIKSLQAKDKQVIAPLLEADLQLRPAPFFPLLAINYDVAAPRKALDTHTMSYIQTGFHDSMQVLLDPQLDASLQPPARPEGADAKKKREELRAKDIEDVQESRKQIEDMVGGVDNLQRFLMCGDVSKLSQRQSIVAFLRHVGILDVQSELGKPVHSMRCSDLTDYRRQHRTEFSDASRSIAGMLLYARRRFHSLILSIQDVAQHMKGVDLKLKEFDERAEQQAIGLDAFVKPAPKSGQKRKAVGL